MGQFDQLATMPELYAALERRLSALERKNAARDSWSAEWVPLTLLGGWTNYGNGAPEASAYTDGLGRVWLRGYVLAPGGESEIARLEGDLEPAYACHFECIGATVGVRVDPRDFFGPPSLPTLTTGVTESAGQIVHLESISYRTK